MARRSFSAVLVWGVLLAVALSAQAAHTWTDPQGRKFSAKFVRVHEGNVVLLRGGRAFMLPVARLTAEDEAYVREQLEAEGKGDLLPRRFNAPGAGRRGGAADPLGPATSPEAAESRQWTDQRGRQITATFLRLEGTDVVVEHQGKSVPIPLANLSPADQQYARQQHQRATQVSPSTPELIDPLAANSPPGMQRPGMQQPGMQQPGMQQPGMQRPGMQPPGFQPPAFQPPGGFQRPGAMPPSYTPPGSNPGGSNPGGSNPGGNVASTYSPPNTSIPGYQPSNTATGDYDASSAGAGSYQPPSYQPPNFTPPASTPPSYTPPNYGSSPPAGMSSPPGYDMASNSSPPTRPSYEPSSSPGYSPPYSSSPASSPGMPSYSPGMPVMQESKMCMKCRKEVPSHLGAGDRCPHCNVFFHYEETADGQKVRASGSKFVLFGLGGLVGLVGIVCAVVRVLVVALSGNNKDRDEY